MFVCGHTKSQAEDAATVAVDKRPESLTVPGADSGHGCGIVPLHPHD
jgi:hypothetical protein